MFLAALGANKLAVMLVPTVHPTVVCLGNTIGDVWVSVQTRVQTWVSSIATGWKVVFGMVMMMLVLAAVGVAVSKLTGRHGVAPPSGANGAAGSGVPGRMKRG
ncbi:hypothetical protein COO60DRAFT_1511526 [Scenedesmus sp. NREL 46B-D3]|nr:hypothetical protein COO60DRAFT_1511526 [Scenedesmus sp. NREL 46B-D3]